MEKSNRTKILAAVVLGLCAVGIWQYALSSKPGKTEASSTSGTYYRGPLLNKALPGVYGDDTGARVAPPPDANPPAQPAKAAETLHGPNKLKNDK